MPQVFRVLAVGAALAALAATAVLAAPPSPTSPPGSTPIVVADAPGEPRPVAPPPTPAARAAPVSNGPRVAAPLPDPTTARNVTAGAAAARTTATAVVYDWPLAPPTVTRAFDDPEQPWLAGHRGVDLAGSVAEPVRAAADGVVAFAGSVAGRAVVSIDHADGIRTTYEPVSGVVTAGQVVARGEMIGALDVGHPGPGGSLPGDGGATLHWGARTGSKSYVDPTLLVGGEVVIRLWE